MKKVKVPTFQESNPQLLHRTYVFPVQEELKKFEAMLEAARAERMEMRREERKAKRKAEAAALKEAEEEKERE